MSIKVSKTKATLATQQPVVDYPTAQLHYGPATSLTDLTTRFPDAVEGGTATLPDGNAIYINGAWVLSGTGSTPSGNNYNILTTKYDSLTALETAHPAASEDEHTRAYIDDGTGRFWEVIVDDNGDKEWLPDNRMQSTPSILSPVKVEHRSFDVVDNRSYEKWLEVINIASGGETVSGISINTFRIPSIQYASNGDLLVAAEARIASDADNTANAIFFARLRDGVLLEKKLLVQTLVNEHLLRNPNMVLNGDRVYMFFTSFSDDGTPNLTNDLKTYYIYSDDNGETWSSRVEYLETDQDSSSSFKWTNSPANSILLANGNIIIPFWGKYVAGTSPTWFRSGIIVWDGTTFVRRTLEAVNSINEPTIYEDENGYIVMSCRTGSTGVTNRVTYFTTDEGLTWQLHPSSGANSFSVYVNIKRYGNQLYRLEISDGAVSSNRKDLDFYKTDLTNVDYDKVIPITPRGQQIWGYGASDYYRGNMSVLSEDKPDLNLYNVFIEDKGVLNIYKKEQPTIDPNFFASMIDNGNDSVIPLSTTNGGNVDFSSGSYADFDGSDNAYLEYPDNDAFDFTDGTNDIPFTIHFKITFNQAITSSSNILFLNKSGADGLNRTIDIRIGIGKLRFYIYSELNSSNNIFYESNVTISQGQEYKVEVTYDGNRNPLIYVNNILDGQLDEVGTFVKIGDSTQPLIVGRLRSSSSFNFNGEIRDLKVFKGVVLNQLQRISL